MRLKRIFIPNSTDNPKASHRSASHQKNAAFSGFGDMAQSWWSPSGPMASLHAMSQARLECALEVVKLLETKPQTKAKAKPKANDSDGFADDEFESLEGLEVLDLGAGAGLMSEPMARLGAKVCAVESEQEIVAVGKKRAGAMGLDIDYQHCDIFAFRSKRKFDLVLLLEVIEHVESQADLVAHAADYLKEGGILLVSTVNRSPASWLTGIVIAEQVLSWLPRGTHDWQMFVKPVELASMMRAAGLDSCYFRALDFMPFRGWRSSLRKDPINYLLAGKRSAGKRSAGYGA